MVQALYGPDVGFGRCLGLLHDGVGDVEVQCRFLSPGSRGLIMTANLSDTTQMCIRNVYDFVANDTADIARCMGMSSAEGLELPRGGYDLHVHVEHEFQPIVPTYIMGAIYVSLVSLVLGRRGSRAVSILGSVGNAGSLTSPYPIDQSYVATAIDQGYRRAIIASSMVISDEAKAMAEELHEDGEPRLKIIRVGTIRDALPVYFDV